MKKFLLSIVFLFSLNVLFSNILNATTYYISPSGNDASAGTSPGTAWQTVAKINSINIQPGDSILFEGGQTFSGYIRIDANDGNDSTNVITFSSYGTGKALINSGDSTGFYAYNTGGFTISHLIFEGSGMHSNTSDGIFLYADLDGDVKFTNEVFQYLEIRNYGGTGLRIGAWPISDDGNTGFKNVLIDSAHIHDVLTDGIDIWGFWDTFHVGCSHQNVWIRNTLVHDATGYPASGWRGSGIVIAEVDSGVIEHCVAHHNGSGNAACGGPVGIWAWDANNVTIQFCESHHNSSGTSGCDGGGFDFDGGTTNSVCQYNYSHDNAGYGYETGQFGWGRPMGHNVFRYNISENDGQISGGGLSMFRGDPSEMVGTYFYNNTIYLSPSPTNISNPYGFNIVLWDSPMDSSYVFNNIFVTRGSKDSINIVEIPAGYDAYFAGNLYWSPDDTMNLIYQGITYTDLASWRAATGNEMVGSTPTGIYADPLLTNAGNGGTMAPNPPYLLNAYKLPANSPAVNTGLDLSSLFGINAGSRDFFGNPAPVGASDIGAYESSVLTDVKTINLASYPCTDCIIGAGPMPFHDRIKIDYFVKNGGPVEIKVVNLMGQVVKNESALSGAGMNSFVLNNLSDLSEGIYFLRVTRDGSNMLLKVIKN